MTRSAPGVGHMFGTIVRRAHARGSRVRRLAACIGVVLSMFAAAPAAAQNDTTVTIEGGSGSFALVLDPAGERGPMRIFYHRPARFTPESPILVVLPGAGRNADDYRDAWIEASERYGVLVISPSYPASEYDFGAYHMGGTMREMNLDEVVRFESGSNRAHLNESDFEFEVDRRRDTWIFADIDRLFEVVARSVGSQRTGYDAFGHSAGGQILHRMAIFRPESRAERLLAANSGFFTLPDLETALPFGVRATGIDEAHLMLALQTDLVLFQGEYDDARETGGTMLRSPTADLQGTHRLARARHAYDFARRAADRYGVSLGWRLEVVPGVGHEYRRMSEAAAVYLYGEAEAPAESQRTAGRSELTGSRPAHRSPAGRPPLLS